MKTFTVTLFIRDADVLPDGFTVHMPFEAKNSGEAIYNATKYHLEAFGGDVSCIGVRTGSLFNGVH